MVAHVANQLMHETPLLALVLLLLVPLMLLLLQHFTTSSSKQQGKHLPPSPPGLPVIGHLHLVGDHPHVSLCNLARRHGTDGLMLLRLGAVPNLIVSSPRAAQAIMRTHDHLFASRPPSTVADVLLYGSSDIAFSPYGEYWRQVRKLVTTHLFTVKKVNSYRLARQQEEDHREAAGPGTGDAVVGANEATGQGQDGTPEHVTRLGTPASLDVLLQPQPVHLPADNPVPPPGGRESETDEREQLNQFLKENLGFILSMVFGTSLAGAPPQVRNTPIAKAAAFFLYLAFITSTVALVKDRCVLKLSLRWLYALACISSVSLQVMAFLFLISLTKFYAVAMPVLLLIFVVAICCSGKDVGVGDLKDICNYSAVIITCSGLTSLFFGSYSKSMSSNRYVWAVSALWILLFLIMAIGLNLMLIVTVKVEVLIAHASSLYNILILLVAVAGTLMAVMAVFGQDS